MISPGIGAAGEWDGGAYNSEGRLLAGQNLLGGELMTRLRNPNQSPPTELHSETHPANYGTIHTGVVAVKMQIWSQLQWRDLPTRAACGSMPSLARYSEDEDEHLPLTSDTVFVKDDLGSVTFVRDAQGHVTGHTYHRWDGQEIHAKKIK